MSHQRPLSEQVDFYDDSPNLLDLVTDGASDEDDLWYEAQLKAALEESLSITGRAEVGGVPQGGEEVQTRDEEVASQLQLEEVIWASQQEGIKTQQQQQLVEGISADSWPCVDMDSDRSTSSDEEKSEELKKVLELQTTRPQQLSGVESTRRKRRLQRKSRRAAQEKYSDKAVAFLDGDSVNPELAEVLKGKQCSPASHLQFEQDVLQDDNIDVEMCLVPSPLDDNGIPETWDCEARVSDAPHADYVLVTLLPGVAEYDTICREFSKASLSVVSIERLQNFMLLDRYRKEKEHMDNRPNGFAVNERYLYHGTKVAKEVVCEENLDQRLSRKGHFGRGIYFSDNPRKCLQYVKSKEQTVCILKCRVVLGDTKVYPRGQSDSALKREPAKEKPSGGRKFYDSVKGCPRDFNEFVIYENRRAMTEYIITCRESCDEPVTTATDSIVGTVEREVTTTDVKSTKLKWLPVPVSLNDVDINNGITIATSSEETTIPSVLSPSDTESSQAQETDVSVTSETGFQNHLQPYGDDRSVSDEDSDCDSVIQDSDSVNGYENIHGAVAVDPNSVTAEPSSVTVGPSSVADGHPDSSFPDPPATVPFSHNQDALSVGEDDHVEILKKVREEIRRQRQLEKSVQISSPSGKKDVFLVDNTHGTASSAKPKPLSLLKEDPVELVKAQLVAEFIQVTQIEDVMLARHHVTQADMNLDQAILNYYNSLS